ncbi:MAG: hypothetical protein AAGA81_16080 [Acidobacteriota bacterium]
MTFLGLGVGAWLLLAVAVGLGGVIEATFLWQVSRRRRLGEDDR